MARRTFKAHSFAVVVVLAVFAGAGGCYGPTSVRLEASSNLTCDEARSLGFFIGDHPKEAVTVGDVCDDIYIKGMPSGRTDRGSLVAVPSGSRSARMRVSIALAPPGKEPLACLENPQGCIVARRSFSYLAHEAPRLPIYLTRTCLGVACGFDETCLRGNCIKDFVQLQPQGCLGEACDNPSLFDGGSSGESSSGGPVSLDGSADDGSSSGGPGDGGSSGNSGDGGAADGGGPFLLRMTVTDGNVSASIKSTPPGIDCANPSLPTGPGCTASFAAGTSVKLTPVGSSNVTFGAACNALDCNILMTQDRDVSAFFIS